MRSPCNVTKNGDEITLERVDLEANEQPKSTVNLHSQFYENADKTELGQTSLSKVVLRAPEKQGPLAIT